MNPEIKIVRDIRLNPPRNPYRDEDSAASVAWEKAFDLACSMIEVRLENLNNTKEHPWVERDTTQ